MLSANVCAIFREIAYWRNVKKGEIGVFFSYLLVKRLVVGTDISLPVQMLLSNKEYTKINHKIRAMDLGFLELLGNF